MACTSSSAAAAAPTPARACASSKTCRATSCRRCSSGAPAGGRVMNGRPFVSSVGAGPGDPELVTLKALHRLREAEVVIHDRLIPGSLLAEAPADAEIIDAGKAPGRQCMGQSQINWLIVDRARRCGRVVRLKGGDPAVFGRLADEIDP